MIRANCNVPAGSLYAVQYLLPADDQCTAGQQGKIYIGGSDRNNGTACNVACSFPGGLYHRLSVGMVLPAGIGSGNIRGADQELL